MNTAWINPWVRRRQMPVFDPLSSHDNDDMVFSRPDTVRHWLSRLVDARTAVALRGHDGEGLGSGRLHTLDVQHLWLTLKGRVLTQAGAPTPAIHVTAAGPDGLSFFTLTGGALVGTQQLRAPCPGTLVRVQSRRHIRIACQLDRVWLCWPHTTARVGLRDISEEGLCIRLGPDQLFPIGNGAPAALHLEDEILPIPSLNIVHERPATSMDPARYLGAHMVGMEEEHARCLRRWLAARQADVRARPAAQA